MNFRYVKMLITKIRSFGGMQFSELHLMHNDAPLQWPINTTITANKPPYASGESVDKLIDGLTSTKYYTSAVPTNDDPIIITIDLGETVSSDYYNKWNWYTANDSANRDPVSFELQISGYGLNYVTVDTVENADITNSRQSLAYTGNITIPLPTYTVIFNSNGGTGIMANQSITIDTPTSLSLNTFTRMHYIFAGWATSQYGEVVYTDGETVTNIAEANETITLYAVWHPAPMSVKIQYNASEKNRMDKDITTKMTLWGTLKSECSIIDPVILIECDLFDIVDCNYITIELFNRSYFINNIRSIQRNLIEISCHVDVISSFKDDIRTNKAILSKSENDWNLYLNDGSLKTYQDAEVITKTFPQGFTSQSFVLAVAGS